VSVSGAGEIEQQHAAAAQANPDGGRLAKFHARVNELRRAILDEGSENESTLNEMLGQYGCESVEELTLSQATEYGRALADIHDQFVRNAVDGALVEDEPAF
jgi:hypothetical protein